MRKLLVFGLLIAVAALCAPGTARANICGTSAACAWGQYELYYDAYMTNVDDDDPGIFTAIYDNIEMDYWYNQFIDDINDSPGPVNLY
jgi:hypothetical protein